MKILKCKLVGDANDLLRERFRALNEKRKTENQII